MISVEDRALLVTEAWKVRQFQRTFLQMPPAPIVHARRLSNLLGETVLLQLEACLPFGGSSKARSVAALLYRIASNTLARCPADVERWANGLQRSYMPNSTSAKLLRYRAALGVALDGATLVAASTGSHARAVVEYAAWLAREGIAHVKLRLFVTDDISSVKRAALAASGAEVIVGGDFTDITARAIEHVRECKAQWERRVFLPTDPINEPSPCGLFSWKDGVPGFATAVMDTLDFIEREAKDGRLNDAFANVVLIPTSGGATWAACLAYLHEARRGFAKAPVDIGHVLAVGDENAMPVKASLTSGVRVTNYPIPPGAPSINGLTQRDMSPYAFDLARLLVRDPESKVLGASLSAIKAAQLSILADIGLLPEPAGAATVAIRLMQVLALAPQIWSAELGAAWGTLNEPDQWMDRVGLSKADLRALGVDLRSFYAGMATPERFGASLSIAKGTAIHYVSGANVEQSLVADDSGSHAPGLR